MTKYSYTIPDQRNLDQKKLKSLKTEQQNTTNLGEPMEEVTHQKKNNKKKWIYIPKYTRN